MKTMLQLLLVIAAVVSSASIAAAQWTSVGSAGTVDEADLAAFETANSQVRILGTTTVPATVVVRYNVVAVEGVVGGNGILLNARFRNNGTGARVVSVLRRVNIITGVTKTLLTVDSNAFPSSSDFQAQGDSECGPAFDFSTNVYFVETTLTKSSDSGTPALQALQTGFITCLGS